MLIDYENRHLAARLEQEIYRCAIRNPTRDEDINIFLFAAPKQILELLIPRFEGCGVRYIKDLKSAWKEMRKKAGFKSLLDKNNVVETGRGIDARFERKPYNDEG